MQENIHGQMKLCMRMQNLWREVHLLILMHGSQQKNDVKYQIRHHL